MRNAMVMSMAALLVSGAATAYSAHRLVIVVGLPDDPRTAQQTRELERAAVLLRERDVVVQHVSPETARRERPDLSIGPKTTFQVVLVGKDGEVKLRRDTPAAASEFTTLIDAMPMRREEIRQRNDGAKRP